MHHFVNGGGGAYLDLQMGGAVSERREPRRARRVDRTDGEMRGEG